MKILTAQHVLPITQDHIENGAIAIEDDLIIKVGKRDELLQMNPEAAVEDFGEAVLMPGFVNCHSHLEITAMRGFLDRFDGDFFSWLLTLTKTRAEKLNSEDIELSAIFGALEGAKAGVTCFGDIGRQGSAGLKALKNHGLRGVVFQETEFSPNNESANEDFARLLDKFHSLRASESDLVKAALSPHAPYTVSEKLFGKIAEFAISENVATSIHAAESFEEELFLKSGTGFFSEMFEKFGVKYLAPKMSPIEYLSKVGILDAKPLLAHCVSVSDSDIRLINESGAKIAHCPKSNAKFGHGIAPLASFFENEISVGLGSDSMGSNNTCDMLEEARFALLAARTRNEITRFISPKTIIETATFGGAKSLGLEREIGSLETGKQADIIAVSLTNISQMPVHDIYSSLIFASNARDVAMTMVAGEVICKNGLSLTVDESEVKTKMNMIAEKMS